MCIFVYIVDKLRASHQLIQADLDVEKELQAKLIEAVQSSRPTRFLIMQLEDKLLTQQAASSLLSVSHQRGSEILNGIHSINILIFVDYVMLCCMFLYSYQALVCGYC